MTDSPYALEVHTEEVEKCKRIFPTLASRVGQEKTDAVLRELYLDEFLYYDEWGNLVVDLTDLQLVAVTYALGAFIKAGAQWDGTRAWAGRYLPEEAEL